MALNALGGAVTRLQSSSTNVCETAKPHTPPPALAVICDAGCAMAQTFADGVGLGVTDAVSTGWVQPHVAAMPVTTSITTVTRAVPTALVPPPGLAWAPVRLFDAETRPQPAAAAKGMPTSVI